MTALNPFTGEFYRETLACEPLHARDVLPDGGAPRASLDALSGRRRHRAHRSQLFTDYLTRLMRYVEFMKKCVPLHDDLFDFFYEALPGYEEVGRRRILLGCWGSFQDPDVCDYNYKTHDRVGPGDVRHPRRRRRRRAGHHRSGRHQSATFAFCSAAPTTTTGTMARPSSRHDPLGNPVDQKHPWNQTTIPRPQKRDFDGNYSWVMCPRWLDKRTGDHLALDTGGGADRAAVGDRAGGPGRHRLRQGDRPQRQDLPAEDGAQAGDGIRVEDPEVEQRDRARSGAHLFPGLLRRRGALLRREGAGRSCRPAAPRPGPSSRCPTRRSAAASTRRCAACSRITW